MKLSTRKNKNGGFSLVELIVVISIIGILAAIATPRYLDSVQKAQVNKRTAVIATVEKAKDAYLLARAQTGNAAAPTDAFNTLDNTAANADAKLALLAPYMSQVVGGGTLSAAALIKGTGMTSITLGTVQVGAGQTRYTTAFQ